MRMLDGLKTVCLVLAMGGLMLGCEEKPDDESDTEEADDGLTGGIGGGGGGGGSNGDDGGDEGGDDDGDEGEEDDDVGEDDGDEAPVDFSIIGTWLNEKCEGDDKLRQTFNYDENGNANVIMEMFGSDGCIDQFMEMNIVATYELGELMAGIPARKALDIEIVSGTVTLKDQGMVDDMNGQMGGFCGKSDWALDMPASLADLDCGDEMPAVGMQIYELIGVDGDFMSMGDWEDGEKDGMSEETRPTALNPDAAELFSKVVN